MVTNKDINYAVYVVYPGDKFYDRPIEAVLLGIDYETNTAHLHEIVYEYNYDHPLCNVYKKYEDAEKARVAALSAS